MIDKATILQILDFYDQKKTGYSSLFPNRTIVAIKKLLPEFSPDSIFPVLQRHQWTLEKNTATDMCVAQMLVKLFDASFMVTEDFSVTLLNPLKIMARNGLLAGNFKSTQTKYLTILQLMTEAHIPFEALITLESTMLDQLITDSYHIIRLMTEAHIPVEALIPLESKMLDQLITNSYYIIMLMTEAHVPFETLVDLEPAMVDQLITNRYQIINLMISARQTHQYLIINNIITEAKLAISLINQTPYPIIQNFVNEKLSTLGALPEGYRLNAENITDLIKLVKGVAEIRKNSRVLSQSTLPKKFSSNAHRIFFFMSDDIKARIAGFTGNGPADESQIARRNYGRPGTGGI